MTMNSNDIINKNKFLNRKFLYDLQKIFAVIVAVSIWFFVELWLVRYGLNMLFEDKNIISNIYTSFALNIISFIFGFYNLFTYIWSKKMADKYGIELFGDLDQEWLREEQGYDAKIFGEIYSKNLHFRKLGAKSLFITMPLSFLPWETLFPIIFSIIMIIVYMVYRNVYFNDAMADRWPRVYGSGIVISRILDQDSDFGKKNNEK